MPLFHNFVNCMKANDKKEKENNNPKNALCYEQMCHVRTDSISISDSFLSENVKKE